MITIIGTLIVTLMVLSLIFGTVNGTMSEVSAAAVECCTKAVELTVLLAGSMAFWGGVMQIADKCGITDKCEKLISPLVTFLFKGETDKSAKKAVSMNLTANLLGLGNASTPLGIKAMKKLDNPYSKHTKRNTAMLAVLNTVSVQLIPTTVGAVRLAHGGENPFDITLPALIASLVSAVSACTAVYVLYIGED